MTNEPVRKTTELKCETCGYVTLHAEDRVNDLESATIWHCLLCGTERRPPEPGTPNAPVELFPNPPSDRTGRPYPHKLKEHNKDKDKRKELLKV